MTLSLSAPPPFRNAAPRRQRGALLLASVAIHAAVLIPIALNTVFLPQWEPNERTFELWIDMPIAEPVRERITPKPQTVPDQRPQPVENQALPEETKAAPVPETVPQPVLAEQQTLTTQKSAQLDSLERQLPQLSQQPAPSETLDNPSPASPVTGLSGLPTVALTRPHIEAIDGPSPARDVRPLAGAASLPDVSMPSTTPDTSAQGNTTSDDLDAPVPRRARMTKEEEAALAAAAASGALDDAWVYRPSPGETAAGTPPSGGTSGAAGGSTAGSGTVTFRGTPVDCTQPQMLSDIQRLGCDSAEQRRIQSAIDRGVRVMGTGDARRDSRQSAQGDQRLNDYDRRRQPLRSGVGVSQGSMLGGSERGDVLDEMSGTNREVEKLQDSMRRSSPPRPPASDDGDPDR